MKTSEELRVYARKYYADNREKILEKKREKYAREHEHREKSIKKIKRCGDLCGKIAEDTCQTCALNEGNVCMITGIGKSIQSHRASCPHYTDKRPITNADDIVLGGTNKLLAYKRALNCSVCAYANDDNVKMPSCLCPRGKTCSDGMLEWLKQPSNNKEV